MGGIQLLLAFAHFAPKYSYWARDIIFLITDKGSYGTYAWLEAYHGQKPSKGFFQLIKKLNLMP
jgi:GPI-anchor transamidase subunit GAA1